MVGKIVEYVPQQQTNGYLTYNFPYVQKMPPQQNPQQYLQVIIFIIKIRHKIVIMISNLPFTYSQQNQPPQQLNVRY